MPEFLQTHEPAVRFGIFAAVFALMALWEAVAPRRPRRLARSHRWPSNIAIAALDAILVRILYPLSAIAVAALAEAKGFGLFWSWDLPAWLRVAAAVVVLDLTIYLQHVLFHAVPALWRLHRMHHADQELDVTSGARFHPVEILLSMALKLTVIVALGAPALGVFAFEVILNSTAMFNHSNVSLPPALDRILRLFIVTPDMHRVHHSVIPRETNANFGFNLPWWDRLFGTYRAEPELGHDRMVIGTPGITDPGEQRLDRMLTQPFRIPDRPDATP